MRLDARLPLTAKEPKSQRKVENTRRLNYAAFIDTSMKPPGFAPYPQATRGAKAQPSHPIHICVRLQSCELGRVDDVVDIGVAVQQGVPPRRRTDLPAPNPCGLMNGHNQMVIP